MPCPSPCSNCERKGLPILFTRYAAAYSAREAGMAELRRLQPGGQLDAQPGGVAIQTALYGVRMLRAGYLYLLVERAGLMPEWQGHVVNPHGHLSEFNIRHPQTAKANPACETDMRGATKSMVWIPDAQRVEGLWVMFHPDPIQYSRLGQIEGKRDAYMQKFDVAGWVKGSRSQKHTLEPARLDSQVLEFAAVANRAVQTVGNEQHFGLMGITPQERAWGNYLEQRKGRHFAPVRNETRDANGQASVTDTGAVTGMSTGTHVVLTHQVDYEQGHGKRLKNMADFLTQAKGAVVVCDDPIGIAQELSMHHLTAAIPYMAWLRETDSAGVSNHWKQAVSEAVGTIERALSKAYLQAYDELTDNMARSGDAVRQSYPGSDSHRLVRVRRAGGGYEDITVQELNRRRAQALEEAVGARQSDRRLLGVGGVDGAGRALTQPHIDRAALQAFDQFHLGRLKARDELMDKIAADLQAWLKADALLDRALGRYDDNAPIDSGDGIRCAGQLQAILAQVASAPKGRQWYAQLDLFTPAKKNLVWRMLSLNNAPISTELQGALAALSQPLTVELLTAQDQSVRHKAWSDLGSAIGQMSKTLGAADKVGKELDTLGGQRLPGTGNRGDSYVAMGKALNDGPLGILFVALVAWLKGRPPMQREQALAKAQALTLAHGLGTSAARYVQAQQGHGAGQYLADVFKHELGQTLPPMAQAKGAAMRVSQVQFGLSALALVPTLANLPNKADKLRALLEAAGGIAGVVGSYRQSAVDRYDKFVFAAVPDITVEVDKAKDYRLGHLNQAKELNSASAEDLRTLKAGAARWVVAGAVVGVVFDAADGAKAWKEDEIKLAAAYGMRALAGAGTIAGTIVGVRYFTAPLWLTRANLYLAITTVVLSAAIDLLKGQAWANWLQAGPFRKAESKKIPYKSEQETLDQLAEVLSGL